MSSYNIFGIIVLMIVIHETYRAKIGSGVRRLFSW